MIRSDGFVISLCTPTSTTPHLKKIVQLNSPNGLIFFSKYSDLDEKPLTKQREKLKGNGFTDGQVMRNKILRTDCQDKS